MRYCLRRSLSNLTCGLSCVSLLYSGRMDRSGSHESSAGHPSTPHHGRSDSNQGGWWWNSILSPVRWIRILYRVLRGVLSPFSFLFWRPGHTAVPHSLLSELQAYTSEPQALPNILTGSFLGALDVAAAQNRFLVAYIHSTHHDNCAYFVKSCLAQSAVSSFMADSCVMWSCRYAI